jgi:type I restriction enzyme S subunit
MTHSLRNIGNTVLPRGWEWSTLGEISDTTRRRVKPQECRDLPYIGMDDIESNTMRLVGIKTAGEMRSTAGHFEPGDVLYGRLRPYLNKVYRPNFEGLCSAEFIVFRRSPHIDGAYLQYFLNSWDFVSYSTNLNTGDRPRVSMDQLAPYPFPLPPLGEQHRIVDAIETYYSRLAAGSAALERLQAKLERYRSAVLKAACEGTLLPPDEVARIRQSPDYEPADELLKRILKERRKRWEEEQIAKGKDSARLTYRDPQPPDSGNQPPLPDGWAWATTEQLTSGVRSCAYGVLQPGPHVEGGVPLVRVGDIQNGRVVVDGMKRISPRIARRYQRTQLEGGEVLMTLVGAIGRTAVVPERLAGANTARAVGVIPVNRHVEAAWINIWLRNPVKVSEMIGKAHEVARKTLNLEDLRSTTIGLPPIIEQRQIILEVERRLSVVDEISEAIHGSLRRAERLRQSILKQAFSGQLVPQNPNDEPASDLLRRIRASQAREGRRSGGGTRVSYKQERLPNV